MKILILHLKTTGLEIKKDKVFELYGNFLYRDKSKKFSIKFKPPSGAPISSYLTQRHGHFDLSGRLTYVEGFVKLHAILSKLNEVDKNKEKIHLIVYNSFFSDFIRGFFNDNNDMFNNYFYDNVIEVKTFVSWFLKSIRHKMTNFRIENVYSALEMLKLTDKKFDRNDDFFVLDMMTEMIKITTNKNNLNLIDSDLTIK